MTAVNLLLAAIGLVVSIRKRKQNTGLGPLLFFFLGYIVYECISLLTIVTNVPSHLRGYIFRYADLFDTIIEFLAFFFVIKNHIDNNKIKRRLNLLLPAFIIATLIYFISYKLAYTEIDQYFLQFIFTVRASILVIACLFYYLDLFKKKSGADLTGYPSFGPSQGFPFLCYPLYRFLF
jgi:hypothetical protein